MGHKHMIGRCTNMASVLLFAQQYHKVCLEIFAPYRDLMEFHMEWLRRNRLVALSVILGIGMMGTDVLIHADLPGMQALRPGIPISFLVFPVLFGLYAQSLLQRAKQELEIPVVAIGGITTDNGKILIEAGADMLAVITALFAQADVEQASRSFVQLFSEEKR